jgi:acyl dehydratase
MKALETWQAGTELPAFEPEPVSRLALALYCGASGDHNPIHVDIDFARAAGMDDVIAHGMLSMAWLGHALTRWIPQRAVRGLNVRFAAITRVGERIRCSGRVVEIVADAQGPLARLALTSTNEQGEIKLEGEALVSLQQAEPK